MEVQTETRQYHVLYAGSSNYADYCAVFCAESGRLRQVGSWYVDVPEGRERANERARELAERDGVQWFGRG